MNLMLPKRALRAFQPVISWSALVKLAIAICVDLAVLSVALWAAYALRMSEWLPSLRGAEWLFLVVPPLSVAVLYYFGFYRTVIRFFGRKAVITAVKGMGVSALLMAVLVLFTQIWTPRSVFVLFWGTGVLALTGIRQFARHLLLGSAASVAQLGERVAIYGAGAAGRQLAATLSSDSKLKPVLFIDESAALQGREVQGLAVYTPDKLPALVDDLGLSRILFAIPSAPRRRRREILEVLGSLPVKVMVMPSMGELASGSRRVDELHEVGIEDLLGREPVAPDLDLLRACVTGKNVMVTGAGGSIGSELCRRILALAPARLVLFELAELALYSIERELRQSAGQIEIVPVLGSVQDKSRLSGAMRALGIHTVYHAAAYKHVPLVEHNPIEGLRNNVFGTLEAAEAALDAQVDSFVLISTDKAVRPTNVMGASKRLAEMILQAKAREQSKTRFCMVRFGNVLDSSGSVVPLFREQIRAGGPVTVTHPEIVRYFMTIPEAAQLVIQAGSMGRRGEVFVLDMGEPVLIRELAERMVHLSGLSVKTDQAPDGDIELVYTGLRPGEKLYEELLISESDLTTSHARIRCAQEEFLAWAELAPALARLEQAMVRVDFAAVQALLQQLVHGYQPEGEIADNVWGRAAQAGSAA